MSGRVAQAKVIGADIEDLVLAQLDAVAPSADDDTFACYNCLRWFKRLGPGTMGGEK